MENSNNNGIDLTKLKTGDLIDMIHDQVCGLGSDSDGELLDSELEELFSLVDELRRRSLNTSSSEKKTLHS